MTDRPGETGMGRRNTGARNGTPAGIGDSRV